MKQAPKSVKRYFYSVLGCLLGLALLHACSGKDDRYFIRRVVKLSKEGSSCTGEQVRAPSGVDYILTAAHCAGLAVNGSITATTEEGLVVQRRVIAEDKNSDLLLLEGLPNLDGLEVSRGQKTRDQHVRSFGHGGGVATFKTEGNLVQYQRLQIPVFEIKTDEDKARCEAAPKYKAAEIETPFAVFNVCVMDVIEQLSTVKVIPGNSGGPIVDDDGKLIAVVSAGGDFFSAFVTHPDIVKFLAAY